MIEVKKYTDNDRSRWNDFLQSSKNSSFLFNRDFMEYHKDRFQDHSLIVEEDGKILAMLPANKGTDRSIVSHGGLTYGGFIFAKETKLTEALHYIAEALKFLEAVEIKTVVYKSIPRFYNSVGSDEIDYALFLLKAELIRRDTAFAINQSDKLSLQVRRLRSIKKAIKENVEVREEKDFSLFWNEILTPNLLSRFDRKPVHSLEEISLLASRFPTNIRQFNAYHNGMIMAGATIFETPLVAHAQYISASEEGRKNGAIDHLFNELIETHFKHKNYFDFGIANENEGRKINMGLLDWKEGFGGRTFCHDFHQINTSHYTELFNVINHD